MKKLFVGNLSYNVEDEDLSGHFCQAGTVISSKVIKDRDTGRSKGFGFIEFEKDEAAEIAIQTLDQTELQGRKISVSQAKEREGNSRRDNNRDFRDNRRY